VPSLWEYRGLLEVDPKRCFQPILELARIGYGRRDGEGLPFSVRSWQAARAPLDAPGWRSSRSRDPDACSPPQVSLLPTPKRVRGLAPIAASRGYLGQGCQRPERDPFPIHHRRALEALFAAIYRASARPLPSAFYALVRHPSTAKAESSRPMYRS
jgi:hypothetical protein